MSAKTQTKSKSGCSYCRSLGKPESEWTSHFVHKTPSVNSRLTCPELLKRVCTDCTSQNHTYDKCKRTAPISRSVSDLSPVCPPSSKNRYAKMVFESESDSESEGDSKSEGDSEGEGDSKSENKHPVVAEDNEVALIGEDLYGEEIYTRVVLIDPVRAGKITSLILNGFTKLADLEMLVSGDPKVFNSFVNITIEVLDASW